VSRSGGSASTLVIAGSESTIVRVIASITNASGETKESQSPPIAINAMLPTEKGFTIAADNKLLPDAQFTAGVPVSISVFATDQNGQDVRGDTIINFQTTGGSVTPECTLTENGTCTVTWRSQAPWLTKPQITATTIGEQLSGDVGTISESLELFVSSSRNPTVSLSGTGTNNQYCASVSVVDRSGNAIHPPEDTTVEFAVTDGEILSSETTKTVRGSSTPENETAFETCVFARRNDNSIPAELTVTVRTPGETVAEDILSI
jgi:hypothetical protein